MTNTKSTLIIGYGNPLRSDDGVGWYVAQRLAERWLDGIEVVTVHQLTPELAETVSQFSLVIFIDAKCSASADLVRCDTLTPEASTSGFTHHCTPQALLIYAKMLYGKIPRAYLISVSGEHFDHGEVLTSKTQKAAEAAIQRADALIKENQNARRRFYTGSC